MDVEGVWRRKTDEELLDAARLLEEYTAEGQHAIRVELTRRNLAAPPEEQSGHSSASAGLSASQPLLASRWRRLAAAATDFGLTVLPFIAVELNQYLAVAVAYAMCFAGIQLALLATRGKTIGKWLLGLRIVDARTGDHPGTFRIVVMRTFLPNLAYRIPIVGPITLLVDALFIFTKQRQTLHDEMARTVVVDTRTS